MRIESQLSHLQSHACLPAPRLSDYKGSIKKNKNFTSAFIMLDYIYKYILGTVTFSAQNMNQVINNEK